MTFWMPRRVVRQLMTAEDDAFRFRDPGPLVDGDLELVLVDTFPGDIGRGRVPAYRFAMKRAGNGKEMGRIDLRVGETDHIVRYAGHVGYRVNPQDRGRHYAARACRLLLPLARSHGLREVWITCNPENTASRRTCELAGAEFVDVVVLPKYTDMYQRGERLKCRYRLDVDAGERTSRNE